MHSLGGVVVLSVGNVVYFAAVEPRLVDGLAGAEAVAARSGDGEVVDGLCERDGAGLVEDRAARPAEGGLDGEDVVAPHLRTRRAQEHALVKHEKAGIRRKEAQHTHTTKSPGLRMGDSNSMLS